MDAKTPTWRRFLSIALFVTSAVPSACAGRLSSHEDPSRADGPMPTLEESTAITAWVLQPHNPPTPELPVLSRVVQGRGRPWLGREVSVANRNSNPLNIKFGQITRRYVDLGHARISDIMPLDGGRFLRFATPERGFRAAIDLLTSAPYGDLELGAVFRRWSNNGFGSEILAGSSLDGATRVRDLGQDGLKRLLGAMAVAEGYRSSTLAGEIARALQPARVNATPHPLPRAFP